MAEFFCVKGRSCRVSKNWRPNPIVLLVNHLLFTVSFYRLCETHQLPTSILWYVFVDVIHGNKLTAIFVSHSLSSPLLRVCELALRGNFITNLKLFTNDTILLKSRSTRSLFLILATPLGWLTTITLWAVALLKFSSYLLHNHVWELCSLRVVSSRPVVTCLGRELGRNRPNQVNNQSEIAI